MRPCSFAVFTARIGPQSDPLHEPTVRGDGVEYYCATETPIAASSIWQPLPISASEAQDPVRASRRVKLCLHTVVQEVVPCCDAYLWIDAAYELHVDPRIFLPSMIRGDLGVLRHPQRSSIVDEAVAIAGRHLPPQPPLALLSAQAARYIHEGYPDRRLSTAGLLIRRLDRRTAQFNEAWWQEFTTQGHTRDQMSFDYLAWKHGLSITYFQGQYRDNPYATWHRR